ncbi:hypothetical protein ACFE04_029526 [Oxalis oulophora]
MSKGNFQAGSETKHWIYERTNSGKTSFSSPGIPNANNNSAKADQQNCQAKKLKQAEESLRTKMSKAWIIAASIGAVEALKDQGICRWNYALKSLNQHAKNNLRSYSQANKLSSSSNVNVFSSSSNNIREIEEKTRQSEESLRKVMYLSCWGPNN